MTKANINTRYADEDNDIIVIEIAGSLDQSNFNQIESIMQTYLDKGQPKFILDMNKVEHLSAYVLGAFHGLIKYLHLHFANMIFVNSLSNGEVHQSLASNADEFKAFPNEKEAVAYLLHTKRVAGHYQFKITVSEKKITSGVPFKIKIEAIDPLGHVMKNYEGMTHVIVDQGLVYPTLIKNYTQGVWEGEMILSQPGPVKIRVWDEQGTGAVEVVTELEGEEVKFPINVICPGCHATNVAGKADVVRCVHCNEIYFIDKFGHVIPLRPGETSGEGIVKRVEFTMPSDVNYLNHVRNFIVGVSSEEKIDDEKVSQIEMSLDEALANVIEHAYSYDAYQQINISIALYKNKLEIILRDQGRSFDSENTPLPDLKKHIEERRVGGLGRYLMMTLMDEVDYKTDAHYNQIRMVKKF